MKEEQYIFKTGDTIIVYNAGNNRKRLIYFPEIINGQLHWSENPDRKALTHAWKLHDIKLASTIPPINNTYPLY